MRRNNIRLGQKDLLRPPAYPFGGPQLFQRLRFMLAEAFGSEQTFRRLGMLTGQPPSTTQNWFQTFEHPHLIFFLCLLEQLPESRRIELINDYCRELPLLTNPRLAHDPLAVSALERVVRETKGFTLIRGGTDFQRTFVLTSLGHAFERSSGGSFAAGMDVHAPAKVVPAQGLVYFGGEPTVAGLRAFIDETWPTTRSSQTKLLLLNGIWAAAPNLHRQIIEQSGRRHVILADASTPEAIELRHSANERVGIITLSHAKENASWIRVQVSAV
jgi:hypothetical protein